VSYEIVTDGLGFPVKAWVKGVPFDGNSRRQALNLAKLPFIHRWLALMPDVHVGIGATIGTVIPTIGAVIPAAVGVDLGCGMMAVKTTLTAARLPDNLHGIRGLIERAVPHGRTNRGGRGDRGAWSDIPDRVAQCWNRELREGHREICEKQPALAKANHVNHLGTLGGGNHFIEVCLDEGQNVWIMLHSGSRGIGNRIGRHFIALAKRDMGRSLANLPDKDLAYFPEGAAHFEDYLTAVAWAQRYARLNRELMMAAIVAALQQSDLLPDFAIEDQAINCHHNYVTRERHFDKDALITRKGAVRARKGDLGIIPGSMGARSYIVRGLGNPESFHSCSHGAGRVMSRTEARRRFSLADHEAATHGVECRKDADVIDETPMAYKNVDAVMAAQKDLVEPVAVLRQIVCVKG